jgi:hypothetical protein
MPMINIILTDAIKRIEKEVEIRPDDYSDLGSEIQELILKMETFQDFINNPTLEQLEKLESGAFNQTYN